MTTRPRAVRANLIDGEPLDGALTAVAKIAANPAERRIQALALLREALQAGRLSARDRLEAGTGGIETARLLAHVTDVALVALYDFTTTHVFPMSNEGERLTVMAVGGYGRGAMAPSSDIDLLFLRPAKASAQADKAIEYMLYVLWDLGFKVGHASRTIDECISFAREDFTIRTALLEMRRLSGDEAMAAELKRRFRKDVVAGTGAEFVAAKLAERDLRYTRAGASRYMVEPNVKEGKGALRDLNTLFWIAQYLHPTHEPTDIIRLKEFTGGELKAFIRASDFLWSVRCHLHFVTGRAEERLSFDMQPEIARRMGYGDYAEDPRSVERFMRRYFLIAREVGTLTRTFCAKLEAEHAKTPQGLSRFFPVRAESKRRVLEPGFVEEGGRIVLESPDVFEQDPVMLLGLFHLADTYDLDLHPDAFSAVTRSLHLIGGKLRRDSRAARAFLDILARGRHTFRTLTLMNESGVLGRYMPEFGRIVGQMQFNMYHAYTTDEHTLRAVGFIADLAAGRMADQHPIAVAVLPLIADREALFLAMLLHDTGKGGAPGGQELAGSRNARQACERLGLSEERIELVAWIIQNHIVMSDFAQKRDIADPRTIAAFARVVQTPERMRLLAVLTAADIRAVGPGVWNGWKGQLLRGLYTATEAVFRGGRASDLTVEHVEHVQEALAAGARRRLVSAQPDSPALARWVGSMEDAYFIAFSAKAQLAHFAMSQRAAEHGGAAASSELLYDGHAAEVVIAATDRRGLFADLCGAMARLGANIVGARVYTSSAGGALDIFYVQDTTGQPYGRDDERAMDRLISALEFAAQGFETAFEARRLDYSRTAAFTVPHSVAIDNDASDLATVVEVSGRDRPGLLQSLAAALADRGLSVQSAHVENYGERAVDAFYVLDEDGAKLEQPEQITALKAALTAALLEAEPEVQRARDKISARSAAVRETAL